MTDLNKLKKAQLIQVAHDLELDVSDTDTKAELIEAIEQEGPEDIDAALELLSANEEDEQEQTESKTYKPGHRFEQDGTWYTVIDVHDNGTLRVREDGTSVNSTIEPE